MLHGISSLILIYTVFQGNCFSIRFSDGLPFIVNDRDFPELLLVCLEYLHLLPEQSSVLQNILSVLRETARAHRENEDVIQL